MSETAMPTDLSYGKVIGRFILALSDGPDSGRLPDAKPATGRITISSVNPIVKALTPEPTTVVRSVYHFQLDNNGWLVDDQGDRGVWLICGAYKVSYDLKGVGINTHTIEILPENTDSHPVDLYDALPPGGPVLSASEYAEVTARLDAMAMVSYAPISEYTNLQEIPTSKSTRIDLVYTQPTTVYFANPGLTDIVLSIEGYNYITWEGVSVHGLPDVTGVVWASAMWRDRDSTWHLLCEQDPAGSGGGGVSIKTVTRTAMTFGPTGLADYTVAVLLGGSPAPVTRTIAANGDVTHTAAPMPQAVLDVGPNYATVSTKYATQTVFDEAFGTSRKMLSPLHRSLNTSPGGPTPRSIVSGDPALSLGLVVCEYGTISQPGGQGFRVTISNIAVGMDESTLSCIVEMTENPFSFGKNLGAIQTPTSFSADLHPDFFYQLTFYLRFPWVPAPESGETLSGAGPMVQVGKATDNPSQAQLYVSLVQSSLTNHPMPEPPVVDEDGFAIHRWEIVGATPYSNNIWSRS